MTIKIFNKIKEVIDNIIDINDETKQIIYYNCYLVVYEIRNGFYPEVFNNIDEKKLRNIRKIPNLDFIKCACYDSSNFNDTIYIFNKNKYMSIKKSIEFLNKTKRTRNNKNILKINSNIANLLSYDKLKRNYLEAFDNKKTLGISFIIRDLNLKLFTYQSYKSNLIKNYEKLQKINNLPIFSKYQDCILIIDTIEL